MLGDGNIDSLDTHLEQFKLNNSTNQNDLQTILREYTQLLHDYKNLKKSREQDNRKSSSPSLGSNDGKKPYVSVLIDGNGYFFNDELVKEKEEGGMRAARMLNSAVEQYLHEASPAAVISRVIVRVYCDLTNISRVLAKSQLTGLEKRSLAAFTAGFTRALPMFDFVDALDEEGTKFKIREAFKMAAEDNACSRIFYAACCDSAYLSPLVPFSGMRNKITLIQAAGFNPDFHQFNFEITQFPTVFRWSGHTPSKPSKNTPYPERNGVTTKSNKSKHHEDFHDDPWSNEDSWKKDHSIHDSVSGARQSNAHPNAFRANNEANGDSWGQNASKKSATTSTVCKYFQKGFCRFGANCTFAHGQSSTNDEQKYVNNFDRSNISSTLPSSTVPGFIPINKDGQRLDAYIRTPTSQEWAVYNNRFHKQKPCNNFYLRRACKTTNCPFDHSNLESEARHTLEYVLKCNPCPKKGECRSADCFYGHICQKDNCTGQSKGCRMKHPMHTVDPKLLRMVPMEKDDDMSQDDIQALVNTDGMW
ncbi:hypothetical protein B0J11DRAFT_519510 [Dendryphion nanum]|uniref:C3H1-type domain-containing protein n=1 Tax=Dendryphion nanum TaxID=256645 RepID=A0A9P9IUG8_9PLEO|nr:hypothetical protein B0J11DRAFT_519510 [Dendryphion nanum]